MLKKILGVNLLIFLLYTTLVTFNSPIANRGFNIAIVVGLLIFIHFSLNILAVVACLILGKREPIKSLLISAAVLAPLGFCTWLILLSIYG